MLRNLAWHPKAVFESPASWAEARAQSASLCSLPVSTDLADDRNVILRLVGGKVIGEVRLVASRNNEVIGQLQTLLGIENPQDYWTVQQRRLRWTKKLKGTSVLLGVPAGGNYYHWLFESLPRLRLLRDAGVDLQNCDHLLVGRNLHPFHKETLDRLGVDTNKCRLCSTGWVYDCEILLVPPMPNQTPDTISRWVCEFLRESFLDRLRTNPVHRRLYLSRKNAKKRRLQNEEAVERHLQERGFEIIRAEDLSFEEQVKLFSTASFIVGPHGAAFANLVFVPKGSRVLEFFHPSHQSQLYAGLCVHAGLHHQGLVGTGESGEQFSERLGHYHVSMDQIDAIVDDWINRPTA